MRHSGRHYQHGESSTIWYCWRSRKRWISSSLATITSVLCRGRHRRPLEIRLLFAYAGVVPNVRKCRVAFVDSEGIAHSVEVAACSLYEAAALAVAEFRRCGFADAMPGPATDLPSPWRLHRRRMNCLSEGSRRGWTVAPKARAISSSSSDCASW